LKIIDTHQHLLYPEHFGYAWCNGIPAFAGRAFRLEDYRVAAGGTGIAETVFMEVDVDEPHLKSEAQFFCQLAAQSGSGIVGVLAACRPEREDFPAQIEAMLHPKLKGLRRVLHTQPDEVSQTPLFARNLGGLARHRLTFDLCYLPRQLHLAKTVLQRANDVQFVLDHCGIPDIKNGALDPWRERIRELSQFSHLACKISGVVAYCDPQRVTAEAIRPYFEHCFESFGWDRVLFGGDWPVCNLTSSLGNWVRIVREIVGAESVERQEKFFFRNAERIYRLRE
jgi:predicted TIM-barrel fold metal-dependent hydrolase